MKEKKKVRFRFRPDALRTRLWETLRSIARARAPAGTRLPWETRTGPFRTEWWFVTLKEPNQTELSHLQSDSCNFSISSVSPFMSSERMASCILSDFYSLAMSSRMSPQRWKKRWFSRKCWRYQCLPKYKWIQGNLDNVGRCLYSSSSPQRH